MANYTTVDKVRFEAGFVGNPDVTDAEILTYIEECHGTILSRLSTKYDISLLDASNSNFVWSPAAYKLALIERYWAAWSLLVAEYGPEWTEDKDKGYSKIKRARQELEMIFADPPERLIGIDNTEFTTVAISWGGAVESTGMTDVDNRITKDTQF